MIEYDVYHRKMMFKVICMQREPGDMQYTIYSSMKKHEHFMLKKV